VALSVGGDVRVLLLSSNTTLLGQIDTSRWVATTWGAHFRGKAVLKLLLGEVWYIGVKRCGYTSLHDGHGREGPARTAAALVLDGSDLALLSPIDSSVSLRSAKELRGGDGAIVVGLIGGEEAKTVDELFNSLVAELVDFLFPADLSSVKLDVVCGSLQLVGSKDGLTFSVGDRVSVVSAVLFEETVEFLLGLFINRGAGSKKSADQ